MGESLKILSCFLHERYKSNYTIIYRVYRLIFYNTLFFGTPNIILAKEKHISKEEDYKTLIMFWLKVVLLVIDSSLFSILMLIDIVESI
jgi:hypothetical protein